MVAAAGGDSRMGSVAAMSAQLKELRERAAASTAALRGMTAQGDEVEAIVQRKRSLKPLVAELRSEADTLTRRLKDSSTVVQRVVESVRVLDTAQANTRRALERTVDIVGLKTCVEQVTAAMQAEDWEKAADVMQRHLKVVPEQDGGSSEEAAMQALRRSLAEMQTIILDKCQAAADAADYKRTRQEVQRLTKVMTKIGLGQQAVGRFTDSIARRVDADTLSQVEGLKSMVAMGAKGCNVALFAQCLTKVLEILAAAVDEGEALMAEKTKAHCQVSQNDATCLPSAALPEVMTKLYAKAAPRIADILSLLYERHRISGLARKYRADDARLESKMALELDAVLEEVALCLQRLEQFNWYLSKRLHAVATSAAAATAAAAAAAGQVASPLGAVEEREREVLQQLDVARLLPRVEAVEIAKAQLISGYIPLEEAFMRYSVEKGIRNTQRDEDEGVSALVDEVFYVLKKCTRRALVTSSLNAMGDVIMYAHTLLVTSYKDALVGMLAASDRSGEMHLSGGIANLLAGTTVGEQVKHLSRRQVAEVFDGTCYNNLEASCANVTKLHQALEKEIQIIFRGAAKREEDKAREVLSELASASHVLDKQLHDSISRLANVLQAFFAPHVNALQALEYENVSSSYSESSSMVELIAALDATLAPFREGLSAACFDTLVKVMIADHLLPPLERVVLGKKASSFSSIGAMLFDKDLRALMAFISGLTHRPMRDSFTRLSQIALVLTLGEPQEIFEYNWGDTGTGKISWHLTADEVRRTMLRRLDWSSDRVKALRL